jgi:hypothetical protein
LDRERNYAGGLAVPLPPPDMPPLERLDFYRAHRATEAAEKERREVEAALEKPVAERTGAEAASIAYSVAYGAEAGCGCRR